MNPMTGDDLPVLQTSVPGPGSMNLSRRLGSVECRGITFLGESFPIFWEAARGANVLDVDGNVYVDATGAFGVAALGHAHPEVVRAAQAQSAQLIHAMGDVHPCPAKVELAELLTQVTPGDLGRAIFASSGAEAIEAAMKTAALATGRHGFLAFEGAYHGLTYGALAATHRQDFRSPFEPQLGLRIRHVPFPNSGRLPQGTHPGAGTADCIEAIHAALRQDPDVAGILVEPIQGRGGVLVPPDDFLPALRNLCDEHGMLLIADEIFTGFCRTGRWFAVDHAGVVPDLMCVGKAMSNGFPISACLGRPAVMDAWPKSTGEAIHTSTFLGHPVGCAMAIATIREMQRQRLDEAAASKGAFLLAQLRAALGPCPRVGPIRGRGLLAGIELVQSRETRTPDPTAAWRVVQAALRRGLIFLSSGTAHNVISLSPPLTISQSQLEFIVTTIVACLREET